MGISYNPRIVTDGLVLALDGANLKSYSQNVFPYPLDGYSWGTSGYQMTVSRDTSTSSPVGNSPLKLVTSGTSAYTNTYNSSPFTLSPAAQGQTWTFSFWVKGSSSFSASMLIFESNSSGNYTAYGQPYYSVTTEWTRVSGSYTMIQATTTGVQVRIDCYVNGVTLWVDGFQLEKASSASSFNSISNTNGTTWRDLIGNGNNGTLTNGPTYNSANAGSLVFDGTNDYVNAPLTKSATCTFSCWARTTTLATSPMLFNAGPNGVGPDLFFYNGKISWNTWDADANSFGNIPASVTDGNWHYYVLVNDALSNAKLYYDGVLLGTAAYRTAANNTNLTIGGNTETYMWNGNISNFSIYNRALTAAEIQQNFNALKSRFIPDGSSADRAAPSASYLSSIGIRADGDYWYLPPGQTTPIQLYTVFSSAPDGKGYVLVARGRESTDWWNTNGQNTSALTSASINTNTPIAVLSNSFVNSLINSQWNGMRFITNRINGGDSWLFVGTTSTTFSWTYFQQSASTVNATATKYNSLFLSGGVALNWGSGVHWTDTLNYGGGNNCDRTFTWSWAGHGPYQGWSGGSSCTPAGAFQNTTEGHSIQLVNCYVEC